MPKKLTYEYVKEQIEKEGYKLLSEEYINWYSKLKIQCPKGHIYNTSSLLKNVVPNVKILV